MPDPRRRATQAVLDFESKNPFLEIQRIHTIFEKNAEALRETLLNSEISFLLAVCEYEEACRRMMYDMTRFVESRGIQGNEFYRAADIAEELMDVACEYVDALKGCDAAEISIYRNRATLLLDALVEIFQCS